jgi:hypothetical protein
MSLSFMLPKGAAIFRYLGVLDPDARRSVAKAALTASRSSMAVSSPAVASYPWPASSASL